jgi:hypothetical protein
MTDASHNESPPLARHRLSGAPACLGAMLVRLGFLVFLVALVGCNRGPKMVQVRGKVLADDGSVITRGVREIRFEPMDDTTAVMRRTAIAQIKDDGSFELFTRRPGDGVLPGKYAVTISVIKAPRDPVSLIDEQYSVSATTPYHETIEDNVSDLL